MRINVDHPIIDHIREFPHTIAAEKCRRNFFTFVREFWSTVITEVPVWNWHIEFLCNELEKMAWRVIARMPREYDLIINIPPGTTKSTICTIMFPIWCWIARLPRRHFQKAYDRKFRLIRNRKKQGGGPGHVYNYFGEDLRFITGSYSSDLSLEHAEFSRDIIRSSKFKLYFPDTEIRQDKDNKSNFKNTKGGSRISTSVGASRIGFHGHFIIIDDPINPNQAVSDKKRVSANQWIDRTLSTRKVDKEISPMILIMQRLHEDDPTGHLLSKDKEGLNPVPIRHICLPGETGEEGYEVKPKILKKFYRNNLLDPKRLSRNILDNMRVNLGSYSYAGQVGQDPKPREGAMFEQDWFEIVTMSPARGVTVRAWDLAGTSEAEALSTGQNPAYTVGIRAKIHDKVIYIEDMCRRRVNSLAMRRMMKNTASQDGPKVTIDFPQDPAQAGKDQAQSIARMLHGYVVKFSPETGDKTTRLDPVAAQAEAGNIKLVKGDWNGTFLDEITMVPHGKYKDVGDALARAYARLALSTKRRAGGW